MMTDNSYLALPKSGKGAGVLVLHAWWGLNDFFKDFCQRLAHEGFVALAPDLYHGKTATTISEAKQLRSKMNQKQVSADILSAVEQLRELPAITGKALGVIGFSLGGYWALWLSLEKPEYIKAVTVFYGTRNADYSQAQAAYLGHFAEADDWVAASGVKKLEKSLRTANRPATFYTYEGTEHWFFEEDRIEAYNAQATQLAWKRTLEFLQTQLGK
jgi:carboxymethylenebutenolidase